MHGALCAHSAHGHGLSASAEIGPEGGTIEIPGYVSVRVPSGALNNVTLLRVREVELHLHDPTMLIHSEIIQPVFEFSPNVTLTKPVDVDIYCGSRCPPLDLDGSWPIEMGYIDTRGQVQIEYGVGGRNPYSEGVPYILAYEEGYVGVQLDPWAGTRMLLSHSGVRQRVGPAGGTIKIPGKFEVVIPPNALSETVELRIRAVKAPVSLEQNTHRNVIGRILEFTPEVQFLKPFEIRLWFGSARMPKWIDPFKSRQYFSSLKIAEIDAASGRLRKLEGKYFYGESNRYDPYVGLYTFRWGGLRGIYLPVTGDHQQGKQAID